MKLRFGQKHGFGNVLGVKNAPCLFVEVAAYNLNNGASSGGTTRRGDGVDVEVLLIVVHEVIRGVGDTVVLNEEGNGGDTDAACGSFDDEESLIVENLVSDQVSAEI